MSRDSIVNEERSTKLRILCACAFMTVCASYHNIMQGERMLCGFLVAPVPVSRSQATAQALEGTRRSVNGYRSAPVTWRQRARFAVRPATFQSYRMNVDEKEKVNQQKKVREKRTSKEIAKELLTLYGPVYLGTSISFAAVSFTFFYVLVSTGVDVRQFVESIGDLLAKTPLGRPAVLDQLSPQVGTVALAYIAHKATSPLRFPLTVAAVPFVAKLFKKRSEVS